ncbi:MAG: hypothetical protein LBB67_07480, partial [Oscillospiraceae bacterium]|nr:hypothetical protein [Oscillospiraceae bacterium]
MKHIKNKNIITRRILSLLFTLALLMGQAALFVPAQAQEDDDACDCGDSPVILLPGYSGPQ